MLTARLEAKFIPEPNTGCWLWFGARNGDGYGLIGVDGKILLAHRVMYALTNGNIAEGAVIDRLCRMPCCVNPAHMEAVTQGENIKRGSHGKIMRAKYDAISQCPKGHDRAIHGRVKKNGRRYCAECNRAQFKAWAKRKKRGG